MDTEELIERLGRFRRWVLPSGVMRELLSRGPEIAPALIEHLTRAMDNRDCGIEKRSPEAFFCFHLLSVAPASQCQQVIEKLLRSDDRTIHLCIGEVTQPSFRALITSLADPDNVAAFCNWIDSLVQDDRVDQFGQAAAVRSLFNLVGEGVLEDAEAVRLIRKWLDGRMTLKQDELSAMVVGDFIDIGGKDLKELAVECFQRKQIDENFVSIDDLDEMSEVRQLDYLREHAEADRQLLADPISSLKSWYVFKWTTDDLDPRYATYKANPESIHLLESKPDLDDLDKWLAEIDSSSYENYPKWAIENAYRYIDAAIEQLKVRVRRGVEWAQQGKPFSSNGPYLSALMLAQNCDSRSVFITDADLFLAVIDLTSEQREEWFGDSIDTHLVEALSHVLAGDTQPILQRLEDSSMAEMDQVSLIEFFPISVYHGYLSRNQGLEILRKLWESYLRRDKENDSNCRTQLAAILDAFCLLSIAEDDPVVQQAEKEGIDNLFASPEIVATCRTTPSRVREIMKTKVLGPSGLKDAIKAGVQFGNTESHPPQPKAVRHSEPVRSPATSQGTIRGSTAKAGRNDPCPCGSGKKFKKCCGRR
ncbi:DUF1186 domain-containing protein [Roseimaritima ulvae]|nr:DUF1186 domain-containing protein [Roseimaritima ulvae]